METLLDILKYTLPSLVVFLTAYYILKTYLDSKLKDNELELRKKDHEILLPLRLQAYERMVLFLERISPVQVIFRVKKTDMSPAQLQNAIIQSIREEFEHNIAQQIYISSDSWQKVKNAREEVVRLVNTSFISLNESSTSNELAQRILEHWGNLGSNPIQSAVDQLKKEAARLFE